MIIEYHRPQTLEQALEALSRAEPVTRPMGGGSSLNRPGADRVAVVDLQAVGLNTVEKQGNLLLIGATVTLQELIDSPDVPEVIKTAAELESNFNIRQIGTLAGTLVSAGGRSGLATLLLAMDARLTWMPGEQETSLGDWLPRRGKNPAPGLLITHISLPTQVEAAFHAVRRTPKDWPVVCAGMARWPSGRTRLALGGFGPAPLLAMDGPEPGGAEASARDAYSQAGDEWASAEYRQEMAAVLSRRCLQEVEAR